MVMLNVMPCHDLPLIVFENPPKNILLLLLKMATYLQLSVKLHTLKQFFKNVIQGPPAIFFYGAFTCMSGPSSVDGFLS